MPKTAPSSKKMAKESKNKAAPVPKKSKSKPSPPKPLSAETVVDSDDDEESPVEASDDESLPENPISVKPKVNGKLPAPTEKESSSEEESGSDEEDAESDEEDEEDEAEIVSGKEKAPKPKVQFAKEPTPPPVAPKKVIPYQPPTGFESRSIEDASQVAKPFKSSKLGGKQIWYFTAPASVPIASIQEMSLLGAKNGDVIYSQDGNDYGFSKTEAEENTYTSILVPSSSENGYKVVPKPVDQVLHLGRIIKAPGANANSSKATVPAPKPIRKQPKGLKMRFFPIGFGEGQLAKLGEESSSEEETQAPARFRKPESIASDSDVEMSEAPPVKSKPATSKPHKSSKSESKNGTLKRKHGEGAEKKRSKHSSSKSTDSPNNQQLKRLKTKQTESPQNPEDKSLASTKAPISTTPIPPPKSVALKSALKSSLKSSDAILPPQSTSSVSQLNGSQPRFEETQQENISLKKSKSKSKEKHKKGDLSQNTESSNELSKKKKKKDKSIFSQSTQSQSTQEEPAE
ncbi:hypothetical protein HYFRA_00013759 [Hymenoscyphus fraxineus]|uniref:DNA-directed RNA polymerase I subunit n=1 Tax=Hymenoscyphus fraxineus TaxID=746836 RepID=A0A9N9PZP8_9HELO|nr:hypothetical protein HYFRA_00013759 [Hymenoscyphus fraxineus]